MQIEHLGNFKISFAKPPFLRKESTVSILQKYDNILIGVIATITEQNMPYKILAKWDKNTGKTLFCEEKRWLNYIDLIDLKVEQVIDYDRIKKLRKDGQLSCDTKDIISIDTDIDLMDCSLYEKLNIAMTDKLQDPVITGKHEYTVTIDNFEILISLDHSIGMIKILKIK